MKGFELFSAEEKDIPEILELCGDWIVSESKKVGVSCNKLFIEDTLRQIISHGHIVIKSVSDSDNKIVGVLALGECDFWWSDDDLVTNVIFFVAPKWRNIKHYLALLNTAKDLCREHNIPLVLDITGVDEVGRKELLMSKFSSKTRKIGITYIWRPEWEKNE